MSKVILPTFQDILPALEMDAVVEAIWTPKRGSEKPPNYGWDEFDNIKEMVWAAAQKWLPRDIVELQVTGVERHSCLENALGASWHGYMDIEGILNGKVKPFDEFPGKKIVIDWKTRDGELDQKWRERLLDSWQWKMYAAATDATIFSYRGVSRRCFEGDCGTKEIIIVVPPSNLDEVREYIGAQDKIINALRDAKFNVWPRNMPGGCYKYGRECPYKYECDTYTMPRFIPPVGKVQSYSSLDNLDRCKEYYRRETGAPEDEDESLLGTGFHFAMAELYRQAKEIKL